MFCRLSPVVMISIQRPHGINQRIQPSLRLLLQLAPSLSDCSWKGGVGRQPEVMLSLKKSTPSHSETCRISLIDLFWSYPWQPSSFEVLLLPASASVLYLDSWGAAILLDCGCWKRRFLFPVAPGCLLIMGLVSMSWTPD